MFTLWGSDVLSSTMENKSRREKEEMEKLHRAFDVINNEKKGKKK
jgi:hypothetical protein